MGFAMLSPPDSTFTSTTSDERDLTEVDLSLSPSLTLSLQLRKTKTIQTYDTFNDSKQDSSQENYNAHARLLVPTFTAPSPRKRGDVKSYGFVKHEVYESEARKASGYEINPHKPVTSVAFKKILYWSRGRGE